MSNYKPGDVAMVTAYNRTPAYRAFYDGKTWREYGASALCVDAPTSVRPLVVLDLPERVVPPLVEYLRGVGDQKIAGDRLDLIADQIEAQTKPAKPAEPTNWLAVVEDADGWSWALVHVSGGYWAPRGHISDDTQWKSYEQIDAVRKLSEGVTQ